MQREPMNASSSITTGRALGGSRTPPSPTPPERWTLRPTCAQEPTVAHVSTIDPRPDVAADVGVARHEHDAGLHVRAPAGDGAGHHPHAVEAGLQRHPVVVLEVAGRRIGHRQDLERQQDRSLRPLVDVHLAVRPDGRDLAVPASSASTASMTIFRASSFSGVRSARPSQSSSRTGSRGLVSSGRRACSWLFNLAEQPGLQPSPGRWHRRRTPPERFLRGRPVRAGIRGGCSPPSSDRSR